MKKKINESILQGKKEQNKNFRIQLYILLQVQIQLQPNQMECDLLLIKKLKLLQHLRKMDILKKKILARLQKLKMKMIH